MSLRHVAASAAVTVAPALLLVVSVAAGPGPAGGSPAQAPRPPVDELVRLYEAHDYFTLRERLGEPRPGEPAEVRVLRAATAHAFNDLSRSDALLDGVLSKGGSLSDSLLYEARRIRSRNLLRLYRYREAAEFYEKLASEAPAFVDSADVEDHRNMLRATRALEEIPPQRATARSATVLPEVGRTHVEVTIGDSVRDYSIDTGADFSVLIRSEAEGLGLEVREAGVKVGSATDIEVTGDLAVADRVRLGGIELRDVAFLVLPDEALTFPRHDLVVRGVIGFPVLEALGEVTFRADGALEVPGEVPDREVRNLALHDLSPYVRVGYRGDQLLCTLDTGSMTTHFWEPFYRRYRSRVEAEGTRDTFAATGAGGTREIPGYRLEDVTLGVGGRTAALPEAAVYTKPVWTESSNVVECNVGRDVLSSHGAYTLNFRSMSVLLR